MKPLLPDSGQLQQQNANGKLPKHNFVHTINHGIAIIHHAIGVCKEMNLKQSNKTGKKTIMWQALQNKWQKKSVTYFVRVLHVSMLCETLARNLKIRIIHETKDW